MSSRGHDLPASAQNRAEPLPLRRPLKLEEVETPALLIDVAVMEDNLRKMADHARHRGIGLRPHTKTHKCPILAKKQMELGAVGICTAKVSEAEVMVEAGLGEVLITSPVVTREKIARAVALAKRSDGVRLAVDNRGTAQKLHEAAATAGIVLPVLIDLDVGTRRTGIAPGPPALELLEAIQGHTALRFCGLQAYAGHLMHVDGREERQRKSHQALEPALSTRSLMERAGFEVPVLSVGGTGTFDIDCDMDGVTDLQVGSYLFMDVEYGRIGGAEGQLFDSFAPSLFVLVTAISQPVAQRITVDAGYKSFATDSVLPELREVTGVGYLWGGDEHLILELTEPSREIRLGDKLEMIVPHCDPTVNLYDYFHPYRNGQVEELWPIAGRGRSQ